ncbi:MAG: hypothetical protein ACD_2C00049G0001 [uncultured bacterium (gcode 4)]|uniref:Vitamin K epoxide reductase domain-containing protein n=1 Tax=uncultured bacterium (gcode 4) TaxID=1234023 RepID=K2G4A2_9BACT|nr:MAG: hypothetical protein ACD_2C00049G0001 [uncultured bacterium (gcode 4)]
MKKLFAICILSIIAFWNATYLTMQNYRIENLPANWKVTSFCDLNNTFSCTNVLSSPYSKVFGLPFPAIAMAVYPIIFLIAFLWMQWIIRKPFHILAAMWTGWLAFNWFFIFREYLYIWSYCPLCLICTGIITSILIMSVYWIFSDFWAEKKKKTFLERAKDKLSFKKS